MSVETPSSTSTVELGLNIHTSPSRVAFLRSVVPAGSEQLLDHFESHDSLTASSDDPALKEKVSRLKFANDLASLTGENARLTKALLVDPDVGSLRDVALKYSDDKVEQLLAPEKGSKPQALVAAKVSSPSPSPHAGIVAHFQQTLFNAETSAFIVRMLQNGELDPGPPPSAKLASRKASKTVAADTEPIRAGMTRVLQNKPNFHFRNHPISSLLSDPESFAGVQDKNRSAVATGLKNLQLAQALTSTPKALPVLAQSKLSAWRVAQIPEQQFVDAFGKDVGGEDIAKDIHRHAVRVAARNDHALTSILQSVRGAGIAAIDGTEALNERFNRLIIKASELPEQINLEKLFGSLDYCECSDCTSVTSPASYFVELLQFLRNNNLSPKPLWSQWTNSEDFRFSALDYLFKRRPDLACLELTCANTNMVLPYIDLANEVMESFIVHQKRFADSKSQPKQDWIDIFNASDNADGLGGSSEELLAVPQNVNMHAYLALQQSVYPAAALPYNQPLDAVRQFLTFLQTSRAELLRIFQAKYTPPTTTTPDTWGEVVCPPCQAKLPPPCPPDQADDSCSSSSSDDCDEDDDEVDNNDGDPDGDEDDEDDQETTSCDSSGAISAEDQATLAKIHQQALSRAVAAEELSITQEEYIILTKQAFWRKAHFDIRHGEEVSVSTYRKRIGVKHDWQYWGLDYSSPADMLDTTQEKGLTYVKKQFLPRTGILYSDLVDVLRTNFINPSMLKGHAKVIMESIRFSYQFLASKIDANEKHRKARLKPLLQFLEHPVDNDSGFQNVVDGSLKKQTCCQLLYKNRHPPRLERKDDAKQSAGVDDQKKHKPAKCQCGCDAELKDWICKYFESVGKIIVLDAGEGQTLPWEGDIIAYSPPITLALTLTSAVGGVGASSPALADGETLVGHIHTDGSITQSQTSTIPVGYVSLSGVVYDTQGNLLINDWTSKLLKVVRTDQPTGKDSDGSIDSDSVLNLIGVDTPTPWTITYDDCDLTKVKLQHLDGKSVTRKEYDKMHRFLRLWRKLGWTIAEVDAAISAFGQGFPAAPTPGTTPTTHDDDDVDYNDFQEPCGCGLPTCSICNGTDTKPPKEPPKPKYCSHCGKLHPVKGSKPTSKHCSCKHGKGASGTPKPTSQPALDISPYLITQVAAAKKIVDLSGLTILQILALWTNIDTHGDTSLYVQLFLSHDMLGIDRVFVADTDGNYLVQSPPPKISEHRPILLAAFHLKPDDLDNIIRIAAISSDQLTLETVSAIYRHSLIANVLGVKPKDLELVFKVLYTPWESAEKALALLKLWGKITDAGFDIKQLAFIFDDVDDPLQPIASTEIVLSQLAATIYSSLKDIETQQPFITTADDATTSVVTAKAQLVFSPSTVSDIVGFLEGTRVYSTNAPTISNATIPDNLKDKLKYVIGDNPTLQTTGQLTAAEAGQAKAVAPANAKWLAAVDRLSKQATTFFNTVLSAVFPNQDEAKAKLLSGDIVASDSADNPPTPPGKRLYFLQAFIPFLQSQISTQSIVATMASASSIANPITAALLQDILKIGRDPATNNPGTRALDTVESIKNDPSSQSSWSGYLIISTTDKYTLYAMSTVDDNKPASVSIDGQEYEFSNQQEDPTNVWYGQPIQLTGGKLYKLQVRDQVASKLMWKTDLTVPTAIPSSFLIPSHATTGVSKVLTLLIKAAFFINGFSLTLDEVSFFQNNGADFDGFDWNSLTLQHWKRLNAYVLLKKSLPTAPNTLLQLFAWAKTPGAKADDVPSQVNKATLWKVTDIAKLIAPKHFNLQTPPAFRNEISLAKLQEALNAANKISVDIDRLFNWAKPAVDFATLQTIASDIKVAIRSKYTLTNWDQAIKPTYDVLRQNQSNALVAYLVVQPDLVQQGIIDADSLFEFFLIDPSICPCMETSRLKQATSSVQLFIQRCLLGLEDQGKGFGMGVSVNLIDRDRWTWMQRYRLWEANRKVYLFPENWIQSSLRDDKSPQFEALESELLQKDISEQSVLSAMKNYLFAVDEVANLRTVAVYVEDLDDSSGKNNVLGNIKTVHFFGRPASSPYKYYYRTFDAVYATWTAWTQMQVDVPNYEIERKDGGNSNLNGCYIVPFMYNGRLIVGLPQFMKKQVPQPVPSQTFSDMAQGKNAVNADSVSPQEYWEIKFGYTELLDGTWKQKVISSDAVWEPPVAQVPEVYTYQFIPEIQGTSPALDTILYIDVLRDGTAVGRFAFNGSRVVRDSTSTAAISGLSKVFQYTDGGTTHTISSLQSLSTNNTSLEYPDEPEVTYPASSALDSTVSFPSSIDEPFNHQFMHALVGQASSASTLDQFFTYFQGSSINKTEAWGGHLFEQSSAGPSSDTYNEQYRTYSLYNWEMAFHAPMLLAEKLLQTQQFDLALKMCHYVFDPYAKGAGTQRFWQMPAFQDIDSLNSLEKLFSKLQPNASVPVSDPINQWRDDPFQPHVLARLRPVTYMKWTVMKYIEILIAYGDWYFQQNTLEMIPVAIQMYVLASHIYGQRGQKIPKRGKKRPETYLTLLNKWDAFGNAMVQLELDFPFSNQIQKSYGNSNGVQGLANIFGFATNRYFCIPNNDQLSALRDTIDDRLFKIRHCQDIKGVFRILPLYEPPLDVGQLVAAAAEGLSLRSVLNDLNAPMPNYKFTILLAKAIELCGELKTLGGAFLSAKEKQDGEAIGVLRQRHDLSIQNLIMQQKKLAVQEAEANLVALQASRARPEFQLKHSLKLLGQDTGLVPGPDDDWQELADDIPAPVQDSGLTLSAEEKEEMDKASDAKDVNMATSVIQAIASELKAFPTINGHASPFGVGVAACWGPGFIGDVMNGVGQVIRIGADSLSFESTAAGRKNIHNRTKQDRLQTANSTGYELKSIDKQVLASRARIAVANQEIVNQQKQIDNSQEVLDFLTNKYTNEQLYSFMEGRVRALYYQTYQMAYTWARKAEACFRFERGVKDTNFIQPGYWEPGHDGLLSGEALFMSLKTMEAAYHEDRGHDFEVSKFVSLRQINPLALLQLRENGTCEFAVPEVLYDMDFPGHYLRKIKAVTLTIPCIIGPYTTVNCTVRLTAHKYRSNPTARDKRDYVEKTDGSLSGDPRFDTVLVPIAATAVSSATNDGGVFDLSLTTADRFLPFEGAGAISQWRLTLPASFRQFDYSTIQDVVMHIRYTSRDGGDTLAAAAAGALDDYIRTVADLPAGLFSIVDARTEFASAWAAFTRPPPPPPAPQARTLVLTKLNERLPVYTKGHAVSGLVAEDVWIVTDAQVVAGDLTIAQGNNVLSFSDGQAVGGLKVFAAQGPVVISDWILTLANAGAAVAKLWVLMRYAMK